jgi:SAM-dependent methyltransferase
MWNGRYREPDYLYGTEPNDFLAGQIDRFAPDARILSVAEGEGRNAVFMASRGLRVTAVDSSHVGLVKARRLAARRSVAIHAACLDLGHWPIPPSAWDGIVSIFCHPEPAVRRWLMRGIVDGLRPGGLLLLEAYVPRQLELGTGGPPRAELMLDEATLRDELSGLEFLRLEEVEREIREGRGHHGRSAVVQVVARKPRGQSG